MLLLALRTLASNTHRLASPVLLGEIHLEVKNTLAQPGWLHKIASHPSKISNFSIRLALRILRVNVSHDYDLWEKSHEDIVDLTDLAQTIDHFIVRNVNAQSALFITTFKRVRTAITRLLTNALLSSRLDPSSRIYDQCVATPMAGYTSKSPIPIATARERQTQAFARIVEEEGKMLRLTGLDHVETDLRDLVKRMGVILELNASVFGEVYRGPGMMIGP